MWYVSHGVGNRISDMKQMDWWTIVSTFSSVIGLGVGVYVLIVAKGAKTAAQGARTLARKRNLAEELENTRKYIEQVGDYLHKREWMAVRIRAQEVMTSCRESLSRWPDGLSQDRKNEILNVSALVRSIAEVAASEDIANISGKIFRRLTDTQLQAAELLSAALGEARNREERDGG